MYLVAYLIWGTLISSVVAGPVQSPCFRHVPCALIHSVLFDHFILKHLLEVGAK